MEAVREQATAAEIAKKYKVNVNMVHKWKKQLLENVTQAFVKENGFDFDGQEREAELLEKIGELTVERDFLSNGLGRLR